MKCLYLRQDIDLVINNELSIIICSPVQGSILFML